MATAPEPASRVGVGVERPPVPLGPWECGFPRNIDKSQFTAGVEIIVDATGVAESAAVPDDAWGFGDLARDCAMTHHYLPALDSQGKPVRGTLRDSIGFSRMPSVGEMVTAIDLARRWTPQNLSILAD
jgi:hypothetical protein